MRTHAHIYLKIKSVYSIINNTFSGVAHIERLRIKERNHAQSAESQKTNYGLKGIPSHWGAKGPNYGRIHKKKQFQQSD